MILISSRTAVESRSSCNHGIRLTGRRRRCAEWPSCDQQRRGWRRRLLHTRRSAAEMTATIYGSPSYGVRWQFVLNHILNWNTATFPLQHSQKNAKVWLSSGNLVVVSYVQNGRFTNGHFPECLPIFTPPYKSGSHNRGERQSFRCSTVCTCQQPAAPPIVQLRRFKISVGSYDVDLWPFCPKWCYQFHARRGVGLSQFNRVCIL